MGATERFTRREFQRILDVSDKQLAYWEKLGLVSPHKNGGDKFYDFRDLISLRTAKQLIENGVSANRLRRSLVALNQKLSEVKAPLTELRILSNGRDVIVEHRGAHLEPISGQFVLDFDTRGASREIVTSCPSGAPKTGMPWPCDMRLASRVARPGDRCLPGMSSPPVLLTSMRSLTSVCSPTNMGIRDRFRLLFFGAVKVESDDAVAHAFDLGSVLDELAQLELARQHLRIAVRLDPRYADAHYNLAFVCDKLGSSIEARQHWQQYIHLDPSSPWCAYARQRLAMPLD